MEISLSIIVPVRDMEQRVAATIRAAAHVEQRLPREDGVPLRWELLALDERSGDNTLSVLSVLHGQIPNLRTLRDVDIGQSIRRGARVARGRVWLILDHPVSPELAAWGVQQCLRGQRAALVPGELLAVERTVGTAVFRSLSGGLMCAQAAVVRYLRRRGDAPAYSPPPDRSARHRARLFVRQRLGRLGLTRFDRPGS